MNTQIKTISLGSQTIRVSIKPGKVGSTGDWYDPSKYDEYDNIIL